MNALTKPHQPRITTDRQHSENSGFTIIELMIALSILATILVMSTVILIQIGALYSKGVNSANLQNTTRNIVTDVSSSLQFTANGITTPATNPTNINGMNVYAYCIGTTRYSYVLDRELGTDQGTTPATTTQYVLWRDTLQNPSDTCAPLALNTATPTDGVSAGGYEMMGNHMRVTNFSITETANDVYSVSVSTAFGDSDLLNAAQTNCTGGAGEQFCATSQITTVVTQRVQ